MLRRLALLLLAGLVLAGCGGGKDEEPAATPEPGGIESLGNVLALRSAFEADRGKTRLLVLLSPT